MSPAWLDLRGILLAALLAVGAALPAITTSLERRDYYFFEVSLTSTSEGSTQFFWDQGQGFSEYQSSRQPIRATAEPVNYRFMMPMGRFQALRFDPIDGAGRFTLSRIQIVDARNRIVKVFLPGDLIAGGAIAELTRIGPSVRVATDPASNDPTLYLRLEQPLVLSPSPAIWWRESWPYLVGAFIAGIILSVRPVALRLGRHAAMLAQSAERNPVRSLLLAGAVAVGLQCHPVLFQGRSFASPNNGGHMLYEELPTLPGYSDSLSTNTGSSDTGALLFQHLYYPMVQRDALASGEIPLWNRYSLSGEPLLGQGQSMFGDPLNFLTIAADGAAWAWDVRFIIARWLLAVGLGGIVWRLGRHIGAALVTTFAAGFLGYFTYRLAHPANFSLCYSPLILLAWTGLQDASTPRRTAAWLAALVGANWMVITSGTMKEAYMLVLGLNFAGVTLLWLRPECAGRRGRVLALATAAGVGFVLLSAPLWVSFLSAWHHSMTGYDTPRVDTLPLSQLVGFFDDIFYRRTAQEENVVAPALNFLFLAGFVWWLVQPGHSRSRSKAGLALLLAALGPFALAFGLVPESLVLRTPFVGNIVHVGNTFSCVLMILVACVGGLGFADAWRGFAHPICRLAILRFWIVLAGLLACYFLSNQNATSSPFFMGYWPALTLVVALLPVCLRWSQRSINRSETAWLVVLLVGLPLLLWRHSQHRETKFDRYAFSPGQRADLHARSPALERVKQDMSSPGRANGWGSVLYASYNTAHRLEGVYGVDAVRSRHYHDLADALGLQRVWNWDWPNREAEARDLVRKYDLYNVTHWLATRRAGPPGIEGLELVGREDLDVYRSPTAWPRAFFCDRLTSYAQPADFARYLTSGDGRPFAAVQASDPSGASKALVQSPPPASRTIRAARDYRFTPNSTAYTIDAPGSGFAVLTETYYLDDFEVTLNGRRVEYFRVNHAFKGVEIPAAGTYEITFRYWPKHFSAALWAGLAGAILLGLGAIWLCRRPHFNESSAP